MTQLQLIIILIFISLVLLLLLLLRLPKQSKVITVVGDNYEKFEKSSSEEYNSNSGGNMDNAAYNELEDPETNDFKKAMILDKNLYETNIPTFQVRNIHRLYNTIYDKKEIDWFEYHQVETFKDRNGLTNSDPQVIVVDPAETNREDDVIREDVPVVIVPEIVYTNDPQNVHDSSVNEQVRKAIDILYSESNRDGRQEIFKEIESHDPLFDFNLVLQSIRDSKHESINETEVLGMIWDRSKDNENLREAIILGIKDMKTGEGGVVCSSGRISRMIGSLTLLDSNPELSNGFVTTEFIKNDILEKSAKIVDECLERIKDNKEYTDLVKEYAGDTTVSVSPLITAKFQDMVKSEITGSVESYKDKLNKRDYVRILDHCLSAII